MGRAYRDKPVLSKLATIEEVGLNALLDLCRAINSTRTFEGIKWDNGLAERGICTQGWIDAEHP